MVLWEITLGTAYFLGLKRTYKLVLRIQRRLVAPKYPKIRRFLHSKTRSVFDVAVRVHREVQQRDIEVGRNLGNWILRWLDKMKPGAQIRPDKPPSQINKPPSQINHNDSVVKTTKKQSPDSSYQKPHGTSSSSSSSSYMRNGESNSNKRLYTSRSWHAAYPPISMMMKPVGNDIQYRRFINTSELKSTRSGFHGAIRNDIMQWMRK